MFVGDSNVGKTTIINSFLGAEGTRSIEPTNGVDIYFKKYKVIDGTQYINVGLNLIINCVYKFYLSYLYLVKYVGFLWETRISKNS